MNFNSFIYIPISKAARRVVIEVSVVSAAHRSGVHTRSSACSGCSRCCTDNPYWTFALLVLFPLWGSSKPGCAFFCSPDKVGPVLLGIRWWYGRISSTDSRRSSGDSGPPDARERDNTCRRVVWCRHNYDGRPLSSENIGYCSYNTWIAVLHLTPLNRRHPLHSTAPAWEEHSCGVRPQPFARDYCSGSSWWLRSREPDRYRWLNWWVFLLERHRFARPAVPGQNASVLRWVSRSASTSPPG